jgi:hypothetical protein
LFIFQLLQLILSGNQYIEALMNLVGSFSLGALATVVVLLLVRHYFPAYLSEKGKNLATKEDIASITREVERVRHEYSALLEELKARHQLRTASLDRRLQAHQEAFTQWRALLTRSNESGNAVIACQSWWENNCLYLEPTVRQAFVEAYTNANLHAEFLRAHAEPEFLREAWRKVMAFPNVLFEAIQLPPLTPTENRALNPNGTELGG